MPHRLITAIKDRELDTVASLLSTHAEKELNKTFSLDEGLPDEEVPVVPLHMAAHLGEVGIVELFLQCGADPNYRDEVYEQTALEVALTTNPLNPVSPEDKNSIITLLLLAGTEIDDDLISNYLDQYRESSYYQTESLQENFNILRMLYQQKLFNEFLYHVRSNHYSKVKNYLENTQYLEDNYTRKQLCIVKIDPNFNGGVQGMAILYAAALKTPDMLELLYQYDADLTKKDENDWTVFHWAVRYGRTVNIKWLFEHIDPTHRKTLLNTQDVKGNTALHFSARYGYYEITKVLLEKGAKPNVLNEENKFPNNLIQQSSINNLFSLYREDMPRLLWLCAKTIAKNDKQWRKHSLPQEVNVIISMAESDTDPTLPTENISLSISTKFNRRNTI